MFYKSGLVSVALAAASPAFACGGFFCDNAAPVDQSGEQILFVLDEDAGQIEVHVQIAYEGPAEEFSWLLPAPAMPELMVSAADLMTRISAATNPTFVPTQEVVGNCVEGPNLSGGFPTAAPEADGADTGGGGVTVAAELQVGPYDVQILTADDVDALTTWLGENGYDVPAGATDQLAYYVANGSYMVGLKLQKGKDAGDLAPVAMRYAGTEPMIPLRLTSVAATPDMRLQPFILASSRAVPENYLHVQVNPFAIDWLQSGANYFDVITRAADQAGGNAFATDFAGPVDGIDVHLWRDLQYPLADVAAATTVAELEPLFVDTRFQWWGDNSWQEAPQFPVSAGTIPFLRAVLPNPTNEADADFYGCLSCYVPGRTAVDGAALAAALETGWVEPMRQMQERIDGGGWLTRLSSSISADEMTVDPRFVLNGDMEEVVAARQATLQVLCEGRHGFMGAPRRLLLPDGRSMDLPSQNEMNRDDMPPAWDELAGEADTIAAELVEQTGRSGEPTVVEDRRADIDAALAEVNRGCGCDGTGGAGLGAMLGLLGLVRRRR